MDNAEEIFQVIRHYYTKGRLPELIGKALGKKAVVFVLLDVVGSAVIIANNEPGAIRDQSMVRQMTQLLYDNMERMMQEAGREMRSETDES